MDLSSAKPQTSKYTTLPPRDSLDDLDIDLENDSDTTLASTGFLAKKPTKSDRMHMMLGNRYENDNPKESSRIPTALTWIRWGVVIFLQCVIIVFLFLLRPAGTGKDMGWSTGETETGGDVSGLYIPSKSPPTHTLFRNLPFARILHSLPWLSLCEIGSMDG